MKWIVKSALTALFVLASINSLAEQPATPIDINSATAEELTMLNGIGETKANAIVAYREQKGPFTSVEELVLVKGIGEALVAKNRDQISVSQPDAKP